jgi:hypothetical protein
MEECLGSLELGVRLQHINKNLVAKCGKYFDSNSWENFVADWNALVFATSEEAFYAAKEQ